MSHGNIPPSASNPSDITALLPHCKPLAPHICDGCLRDLAGQKASELHYNLDHFHELSVAAFRDERYPMDSSAVNFQLVTFCNHLPTINRLQLYVADICSGADIDREYNRVFCGVAEPFFYADFVNEDAELDVLDVARMSKAADRMANFAMTAAALLVMTALVSMFLVSVVL